MAMSLDEVLEQVRQLNASLRRIADKDQEQEVLGMAIPVVDAVLAEGRTHLPEGDSILGAIRDVMSPESVEIGEPVRVLEVLLVVEQLEARLSSIQRANMEPLSFSVEPSVFDRDF
jgi:hypothetical protein